MIKKEKLKNQEHNEFRLVLHFIIQTVYQHYIISKNIHEKNFIKQRFLKEKTETFSANLRGGGDKWESMRKICHSLPSPFHWMTICFSCLYKNYYLYRVAHVMNLNKDSCWLMCVFDFFFFSFVYFICVFFPSWY